MNNPPASAAAPVSAAARSPLARVVELWSLLAASASAEDLLPRLHEAATFPLAMRFPLLGRVGTLVVDSDPQVRAAALGLLAGAAGPLAWQALLAGMDDSEAIVRAAAVAAFRVSADSDPYRLVHAIFHPHPEVRQQICALPWPAATSELFNPLLVDDACRARVLEASIQDQGLGSLLQHVTRAVGVGELPAAVLFEILPTRFRRLGYDDRLLTLVNEMRPALEANLPLLIEMALSLAPAAILIPHCPEGAAALKLADLMLIGDPGPQRPAAEVRHLLQAARSVRGLESLQKPPGPDVLDEWLDRVWHLPPDQPALMFAENGILIHEDDHFPVHLLSQDAISQFFARLVAAICYAGQRHGHWNAAAVVLAAKLDPRILVMSHVPAEMRTQAALAIAAIPDHDEFFLPQPWANTLLRRQAQQLTNPDTALVMGLARFLPTARVETLVSLFTLPRLAAIAQQDPANAVYLFLWKSFPARRRELLAAIADQKQAEIAIAAHLAFLQTVESWLELTEDFGHLEWGRVVVAIAQLEAAGKTGNDYTDVPLLGFRLGRHIPVRTIHWLEKNWPESLSRERPFAQRLWKAIIAGELESLPLTATADDEHADDEPADDKSAVAEAVKELEPTPPPPPTAAELAICTDLDLLTAWCASESESLAEDAAMRLFELGPQGIDRLLQILARETPAPRIESLTWTITLWLKATAVGQALPFFENPQHPAQARFLVGLALLEQGCQIFDRVAALAVEGTEQSWFSLRYWTILRLQDSFSLAVHGLSCRRSVFRNWSLRHLIDSSAWQTRPELFERLLVEDPERIDFATAARLWRDKQRPFPQMLPLLMHYLMTAEEKLPEGADQMFAAADGHDVQELVTAALMVGSKHFADDRLFQLIQPVKNWLARLYAARQIVLLGSDPTIRARAALLVQQTGFVSPKFRKIVDVCVWGVRLSRKLFGHDFRIRLLGADRLGYTQLSKPAIYVSMLPILAGERNGKAIVEGLILHEFGHHLYHKTPEHLFVNGIASDEKLSALLNLVNDEHLERNLRAIDRSYGDRLKKLASYAFQHLDREFSVGPLMRRLGPWAFRILTTTRVKLARQHGHVKLESGHILHELERSGGSFARFFRGLRMGLGNRHNDPKVEQGLALFGKGFRHSTAPEQLEITRKLREIFQDETELLDALEQGSGVPPEEMIWEMLAEGVSDEMLQAAVDEQLKIKPPPPAKRPREDGEPGLEQQEGINRSGDSSFDLLKQITQSPHDPAAHAKYANQVADEARRLRDFLRDLGKKHRAERFRLTGSRFDSSRATALIVKKDPRVMTARKMQKASDLFLGVLVDCSSSMSGERIENAKRFATLVSEAVRGLRDIDVRNFGFTHEKIIEAGDAVRCGVHGLVADGGNNDAGALWHAAKAALRSKRKAKVLVMISDGAPTSCSVSALKNLVLDLTKRQRIVCAQVAVAPLSDVCFPYHVVLNPGDWRESVRRFGRIVAGLVGKAFG